MIDQRLIKSKSQGWSAHQGHGGSVSAVNMRRTAPKMCRVASKDTANAETGEQRWRQKEIRTTMEASPAADVLAC